MIIMICLFLMVLLAVGLVLLCSKPPIDMRDPIQNAGHKFGEAAAYYRGKVIDRDGTTREALFTADQLVVALNRGERNPEDVA